MVGETDNGACGHPWKTWGHSFVRGKIPDGPGATSGAETAEEKKSVPPFQAEGFSRVELEDLSSLQLNQFDEPWQKHMPRVGSDGQLQPWASWSHTVSFRRLTNSE